MPPKEDLPRPRKRDARSHRRGPTPPPERSTFDHDADRETVVEEDDADDDDDGDDGGEEHEGRGEGDDDRDDEAAAGSRGGARFYWAGLGSGRDGSDDGPS